MSKKNIVNGPKSEFDIDVTGPDEFDEKEMRLKKKYKSQLRLTYGIACFFGFSSVITFLYGIKVDSALAECAMPVSVMGGIVAMFELLSALNITIRFRRGDFW